MITLRRILSLGMVLLTLITIGSGRSMAEPIGVIEKYALAEDREAMLASLIPGSEDYFFYHCLHYQTTRQLERSETILRDWLAEHKGRETALITAMLDRQRLLSYADTPQRTVDYLVRRLGIKLDHAPPATKGQRRFPSRLDVAMLDVDRLVKEGLQRNDKLKPLGRQHLAELFRSGRTAGISLKLSEFLQRVDGPYIDRLDELVIKELTARRASDRRFGDLKAHGHLTLDELQNVAKQVATIADDNEFVWAVLRRMRPQADSDPSQQDDVRLDYLQRVEAYVRGLPAAYNSLKASATYRLLEANLARGDFDRELFIRYLQLPRVSPIIHRDWPRSAAAQAKLSDNFMNQALLPPIGDERPLVQKYLEHFLRDAEDASAFEQYLQPDYLRRVLAKTKLLYGVGSEERWYRMLSASDRQTLRDATELRLSPENPKHFPSDEPTELIVDLKNIDELVVRVYEINTQSYYRSHDRAIDTDIDLDGLVPTHEIRQRFSQPAIRRHRETLSLDQISGRGVWIVDLVGQGVRARALIRRGQIEHVDQTVPDGMLFTVVDENRQPIPTATMLVGSREFVADDSGRIVLPPVSERVDRRAIISDGKIAKLIKFRHLRESYSLSAGMHVDRTQLQSGGQARILIRPRLTMAGQPIAPDTLSDVAVKIDALDLDGLSTTKQVDGLVLDQNAELVIPIRVPSRLSQLTVTLTGKVDTLADSKQQTLQTQQSWDIAGVRKTSNTHDAFLTRDGDDYVIEVRGRNGEPIPAATVYVSLATKLRNSSVDQTLQCDDLGRVRLGSLPGVSRIRFGAAYVGQHSCDLELNRVLWSNVIHTVAGREVRLALANPEAEISQRYRLIETRDNSYRSDVSDRLSAENGLLVIAKLPPGDYQLIDRTDASVTRIAVVDGPEIGSVGVGQVRHQSMSAAPPLAIASIERGEDGLQIRLAGSSSTARVHVYASRYLDSIQPFDRLNLPRPRLYGRRLAIPRSGYVSDLRLGDEYQYVLRRRYANKYPGVMLPQPGVILNPWETEETSNESQSVRAGDIVPPSAMAPQSDGAAEMMAEKAEAAAMVASDYDFLADSGAMLANLYPDADGVVTIPNDLIEGLPLIQIVLSDSLSLVQQTLAAPLVDIETTDLRLAKSLDVDQSLAFERAVMVASKQDPLDLSTLGTAQMQVYPSVASLWKLYKTLVNDPRMAEFDPLANWHALDQGAKLAAYSRLACHELHLFLWAHDRGFFEEIIQPYLENKKEKQFMDDWLLGRDLQGYLTLWRYNQLSAAERVLLAMRVPEARAIVGRQLREQVAMQDVNYAAVRKGIESALRGQSLVEESEPGNPRGTVDSGGLGGNVAMGFSFAAPSSAVQAGRGGAVRELEEMRKLNRSNALYSGVDLLQRRGRFGPASGAFFRDLDSTKQWAESQWDRIRTVGGTSPAELIVADPFWSDLAGSDVNEIQVSTNLLRPVHNRHAALVALALCGLPLVPGEVGLPTEPDQDYSPPHAVAVVTKRLRTLQPADEESSILIGQRFESLSDAEGKKSASEPIAEPTEFLTGVAYRGQTVISNPTAARRVVDVFWQLPSGSVPLAGSHLTDSRTIVLEPFAVQAVEYQFYFPAAGEFTHYPATVSSAGKLIARGTTKRFPVVEQPTEQTRITWEKMARSGSVDQIREFLASANLRQLNWMAVAHRMKDQEIYRVIIDTLQEARLSVPELWAYSLKHRDEPAMRGYLSMRADLVGRVGPVLNSPLLVVNPIEQRMHELLEYAPLVRARIHRLHDEDEILNPTFLNQYRSFVRMLGFSEQINPDERLVLSYYLLIQNRIEESIDQFAKIDRGQVETKLQYDFLNAYLALHQENFDQAERLAKQYLDHPVPRWRNRFTQLALQLNQRRALNQTEQLVSVDGKPNADEAIAEGSGDLAVIDRERRQASAAEQQPEVIVSVEDNSLRIDHRRARDVIVNFYGVDLELLFSKAPFVREDLQRMAMVRPMRSEQIEFDQVDGVGRYDLDENLRRQTLLVEVVAGSARSTALYYGGEITTFVSESFGQLQTTDTTTRRPISTAYVKVYAKYADGSVRFYKDGYTDLRGRFDYASLSASDAKGATRFAILVISEEKGATLHDVAPPK